MIPVSRSPASPKAEEAPLATPTASHLVDKDLRSDVLEVDHVGKGDPHAQESYRQEKRNQVQLEAAAEHYLEPGLC